MKRVSIIVIAAFAFALVPYIVIQSTFSQRIISSELLDHRPVALVLGASVRGRKPNTILKERLDTAARLFASGTIQKLILSGDNRTIDYNEPQAMKDYLVEQGIPEQVLILDHAGRRTYDSCYRARDIFQLDSVIIVSQTFHLPRALYLCNTLGIDAIGIAADAEHPERWWFSYIREIPATIQAWLDILFVKPTPVLGNPEKVF